MEELPEEILHDILSRIDKGTDRINVALTCRRFLSAIHRQLPKANAICVQFADSKCQTSVKGGDSAALITVCQCECHGCPQMLQCVLPILTSNVNSFTLEDELWKESLSDGSMHALLEGCRDAPLSSLSFDNVDFSAVRPWTLALIASFNRLEQVHLLSCKIPEGLLLRSLSSSLQSLRSLSVTDSPLVSDKLCSALAKSAPNLEEINLRRCKQVSAGSVVTLLEYAHRRRAQQLTLFMQETAFDSHHLERCMSSSLMPNGREWAFTRMKIDMGYSTPAILLTHPSIKTLLIFD